MRVERKKMLVFTQAAMELSWLFAWASFLMISTAHRPFLFLDGVIPFFLAVLITRITKGRGLRVIWVLGLQSAGFLLAASKMLYSSSGPHLFSYFNPEWVLHFFYGLQDERDWLAFTILVVFASAFWLKGAALARKPMDYALVCTRFDLGLTAFLALFLIKFLLLVRGGIQLTTPNAEAMIYPFFIFGLSAVGLARTGETAFKGFISGYRAIGLFVSFAAVSLVFGTGLVLFFMPFLQAGAEIGYGVLKAGAEPLGRLLVCVLRFLFTGAKMRSEPSYSSREDGSGSLLSAEGELKDGVLVQVLGWVMLVIVTAVPLLLLALGLWYLWKWLFSRTSSQAGKPWDKTAEPRWFRYFADFLLSLRAMAARFFEGYRHGIHFFYFLVKWGGRSGVPRFVNETPCEYGRRLKERFPSLESEITSIVDAFNFEAYGKGQVKDPKMKRLKQARKKLIHIANWPSRIKSRFLG